MRAVIALITLLISTPSFASAKVVGSLECSIVQSMSAIANKNLQIIDNNTGIAIQQLSINTGTGYKCEATGSVGVTPSGEIVAGLSALALTLPNGERVQTEMGLPANPLRSLGLSDKSGVTCSCIVTPTN